MRTCLLHVLPLLDILDGGLSVWSVPFLHLLAEYEALNLLFWWTANWSWPKFTRLFEKTQVIDINRESPGWFAKFQVFVLHWTTAMVLCSSIRHQQGPPIPPPQVPKNASNIHRVAVVGFVELPSYKNQMGLLHGLYGNVWTCLKIYNI